MPEKQEIFNPEPMTDDGLNKTITALSGSTTFCWLIAWASFTAAPLLGQPFPFASALMTFAAAAVITGWTINRGWRNYQMVGLQLIGLICFGMHTLHASFYPTTDFFSKLWLIALGDRLRNVVGIMAVGLAAGWIIVFWVCGVRLVRQPLSYLAVCNRFDGGLTAFFALLLVQMMLVVRGGVRIAAPPAPLYWYAFFFFGLLAIGLARHRGTAEKQFLPGIRGIAVLLIFAGVTVTGMGLLAVAGRPLLTPLAEEGYDLLQTAARPMGPVLLRILRFILNRDIQYPDRPAGTFGNDAPAWHPEEGSGWAIWLARLLAEGFIAALVLVMAALAVYLMWRLVRWLLQRDTGPQGPRRPTHRWIDLFLRLWAWLQYCRRAVFLSFARNLDIGKLYAALLSWGRHGGVTRQLRETPHEYAERLGRRFPLNAADIDAIVAAFQRRVYGEMKLAPGEIAAALSAWRRLRTPLLWPSRLRAIFGGRQDSRSALR